MIEAAYRFSGPTGGDVAEFAHVGQNIDDDDGAQSGGGFFEQFTRLEQAAYTRKAGREDLGEAADKLALAFIASSVPTFDPANSIFFKQQLADLQDGLRDHLDLMRELGTSMTAGLSKLILDNVCAELRENAADIGLYMDRIACGTCGGGGHGDDKDEDVNSEFISSEFDLSGLHINTQLIGKNWIHGAIKHPGAFRSAAAHAHHGRFKGRTTAYARHVMANADHAHGGSTIRHRAQLALTLAKLRKKK
jgi:hypothetical protein